MGDQYYIEERKFPKYVRFYVRFVNEETGEILPHRSVDRIAKQLDLLKRGEHIKKRKEAERVCSIALDRKLVCMVGSDVTYAQYAHDYWKFDGDRIRRRNLRKSGSIGEDYSSIMEGHIDRYITPFLPKDIALNKMTEKHIEKVVNKLLDGGKLANATVKKVEQAMTAPLRQAYKKGLLPTDPTKNLDPIDTRAKSERGIITPSELADVIKRLSRSENQHAYLAVALSAATGMRQGEVIALRTSAIKSVNEMDSIITIEKAFAKRAEFKDPKGKKVRYAPIAKPIADALLDFASRNTHHQGDLVFWSFTSPRRPISPGYINEGFYAALCDMLEHDNKCEGKLVPTEDLDKDGKPIMIRAGEAIRRERNLVFHGLRHFFVSQLRGKVNDTSLRLMVGHQSEGMTDEYTHVEYENLIDVANASRKIVVLPTQKKSKG